MAFKKKKTTSSTINYQNVDSIPNVDSMDHRSTLASVTTTTSTTTTTTTIHESSSLLKKGTGGIEHELPNQKFSLYLLGVCIVFVLSSFQYGYAIGVINTPQKAIQCQPPGTNPTEHKFFKECIEMTTTEWSVAVSIFAIGGLIGGLTGGTIADLIGRKLFLWLNNIILITAIGLMSLFSNFYVFSAGRALIGLGSGITTVVVPMYLSEISPTKLRGTIGVLPQLLTTIGIFVSQTMSIFLSTRPIGWRLLMGWSVVLPVVQLILLPLCPESPRYLLARSKEAARNSLCMLRQSSNVDAEMDMMQDSGGEQKASIKALFNKKLIRPLIVGIGLQMAQQLCGVNAVFFYSTSIFTSAGVKSADTATAIVGVINVVSTIVATLLMDVAGRRLLLLIGGIGQFVAFLTLSLSFVFMSHAPVVFGYLAVGAVIAFVIAFALALGPVPWLIIGEIFPSSCRAYAMSIAVAVNWLSNFAVAMSFLPMTKALGKFTFFPFTGIVLITIIFTILLVPETKGKSIEEITGLSDQPDTAVEDEIHY